MKVRSGSRKGVRSGRGGRVAPPPGVDQSGRAPRDGYGPGMCARPRFSLLSRRQGARAAPRQVWKWKKEAGQRCWSWESDGAELQQGPSFVGGSCAVSV